MRLRDQVIGALNLFCTGGAVLTERNLRMAGTLANMAAISIISHRHALDTELLAEQLQGALNSRITIEQAKGIIAERESVSMDVAFAIVRDAARSGRRPLTEVATEVARTRQVPGKPAQSQPQPTEVPSTQPTEEVNALGVETVLGLGESRLQ